MADEPKAVQTYLRIKGPPNPDIQPRFKIQGNKIRFKDIYMSEQEDIMAQFREQGTYKFDKIYTEVSQQNQIFNDMAKDIVDSALQGFNGTIFAYGQTGSGKTYTMTGGTQETQQIGLIPRLLNYLFREGQIREEAFKVKVKYFQIYNKSGYDLLDPNAKKSRNLTDLKEISAHFIGDHFEFYGLSQHEVVNQSAALRKFQEGEQNRIVRKTAMNDSSSRSHCIFMVKVITKNLETGVQKNAIINLVDLAGSERIHNSGIQDQKIAKEGININLGLYALSRVVKALGQKSLGKNVHIPYRDNLLTIALQSSMGGNCKTKMIATVNPDPRTAPQSLSTCKFAQQLLCMKNTLKKNQYIDPWVIIKSLKDQISCLQDQLQMLKGEKSKQILDITDIKRIHTLVDQFIFSNDPKNQLPINDRLQIREYLNYMKNMIIKRNLGPSLPMQQQKSQFQENHLRQISQLKQLIQKRDNQINLLLNVINENKMEKNSDDFDGPCIKMQEVEEQKIAEGVVQALLKKNSSKNKKYEVKIEDVQKNLIQPFQIKDVEDMDEAFQRFKDSHIRKESIHQKQSLMQTKQRKKALLLKKIQKLKHERAKKHNQILKLQKQKSLFPNDINLLTQELNELDEMIRKKYKQSKQLQVQISRLALGKNKNTQKIKNQFTSYVSHKKTRYNSQDSIEKVTIDNEESMDPQKYHKESNININNKQKEHQIQVDEVQLQLQDFMKARNKLFQK